MLGTAKAFKLLAIVTDLRTGKIDYRAAIKDIERIFGNPDPNTPMAMRQRLPTILTAIYQRQVSAFTKARQRVLNKENFPGKAVASAAVSEPLLQLYAYIQSQDWSPAALAFQRQTGCPSLSDEFVAF